MATFFSSGAASDTPTRDTALRIQSSLQGKPVPIGWGQFRTAGNLIWEGDFFGVPSAGASGGKGGFFKPGGGTTGYDYFVNVAIAICEGPIAGVLQAWKDQTAQTLASLNLTAFSGSYSQTPWGLVSGLHPDQALGYRGVAYVAAGPMALGGTSSLPNLNYEVKATIADAIAGLPDADPAAVVSDFLTNVDYGLSPSFPIGDLSIYSAYCRAMGLVVSPAITDRTSASSFIGDLLEATNSEAVWSNGAMTIVPYGDQDVSANGASYTAPIEPIYDLTEDDFLPTQSTDGPVVGTRMRPSEAINHVFVECVDRTSNYNPAVVDDKDDAAINDFGERAGDTKSWHFFCTTAPAKRSASLLLGRQAVRNQYTFTLGEEFILLDPMDIVSITDADAGLARQWVRILEIQENADFSLTFTVEEYLFGTGHAPEYGQQANTGHTIDFNADPGPVNTPAIFEPTGAMVPSPEVWLAISGANKSVWGGAEVWSSWDGVSYTKAGTQLGPAITGVLSSSLGTVTPAAAGQTIDQTNTAHVDLSSSGGELTSSTLDATLMLDQLCFVDGEFLSFQNAALTSADHYDLTYLVRGAFDTESRIVTHNSGATFARIDDRIFRFPYTPDKIGATLHLKFLSFNLWGGGTEEIADVGEFTHVIGGTWQQGALGSTVTNFNVGNVDLNGAGGVVQPGILCTWDPVSDKTVKAVRVRYNIKGDSSYQEATFLPGPGVGTLSGLHPSTIYQVQATIDVTPSRATTFTSPIKEITTGANQVVKKANNVVSIDGSEFAASLAATIALVQPTHLLAVNTDILANSTASTVTGLQQTVASNFSTLSAAQTAEAALRVSGDSALSSSLNSLSASVTTNFSSTNAAITAEQSARASGDSANATAITNLTSTVNGHTSTLQVYGQAIDGINAEFGVTIAFDNVIGGFKLTGVKQNADGSPTIAFLLDGDFITNGTITAPKIGAGQIETVHLQASSVTTTTLSGDAAYYSRDTVAQNNNQVFANGSNINPSIHSMTGHVAKNHLQIFAAVASQSEMWVGDSGAVALYVDGAFKKTVASSGGPGSGSAVVGLNGDIFTVVTDLSPGDHTVELRVNLVGNGGIVGNPVRHFTHNRSNLIVAEPRNPEGT